jgi:sortase (surface protein transpeptidase)
MPGYPWRRVRLARGSQFAAAALLTTAGICITAAGLRGSAPADEGTFVPATVATQPPKTSVIESAVPLARSVPVRIVIPAISVNAPVTQVGRSADGTIQVPPLTDHDLVGWYKYGPAPGQRGAAAILGHVDSYTGISVFFKLKYLRPGDRVYVALADGHEATFAVDGAEEVPKSHFPTASVYGTVSYPGLRLITCGGGFSTVTRHYLNNIIVFAHLITSEPTHGN